VVLSLVLPRMAELESSVRLEKIYVVEGDQIASGSKLFELRVDLSAVAEQDCPPVTYFRVVSRERGWVRKAQAEVGKAYSVGDLLALVSTDPTEPIEGDAVRVLRTACAAVVREPGWLEEGV
jgi:pyruvate/2-oxoglutarate dehydrogenase complex dihydrolipoamide acyltransferase (E2) component